MKFCRNKDFYNAERRQGQSSRNHMKEVKVNYGQRVTYDCSLLALIVDESKFKKIEIDSTTTCE